MASLISKGVIVLKPENVAQLVFFMRGEKVMFDVDLAMLYGVEVRSLNQAVARNRKRFPADFAFQLTDEELVESTHRYEVEIQLGSTDEAHIIRTIEYWEVERKRYPQYEHTAVIIAENITGRFLNVISLFNGVIPLIAMRMNAMRIGTGVVLNFFTPLG